MTHPIETGEKMIPSPAVEEEKQPTEENEEEPGDQHQGENQVVADEEQAKEEVQDEPAPQSPDAPADNQPEEKKEPAVLNLNNEVVKMRKEVKRVRALVIRKLTRQISALRKKKGNETEVERNQRRADRLLQEIHSMKVLVPDVVTKTALQKNLDFQQVCKDPKCNSSDRAVARIATHPQFNKKVEAIKAAVKAFKEDRGRNGKQARKKEKVKKEAEKMNPQIPDAVETAESDKGEDEEEHLSTEEPEIYCPPDSPVLVEGDCSPKDFVESSAADASQTGGNEKPQAESADCQNKEIQKAKKVTPASANDHQERDSLKKKPQSKAPEKKPKVQSAPKVHQQKAKAAEESDLESSDDEPKEYFDDSTEERFHKQSSQSEDSDDGDDDFFVGKVSKFKKKKKKNVDEGVKVENKKKVNIDTSTDKGQSELDELESRLKARSTKMESVFCSSLSGSKAGGGARRGRGRGGPPLRGHGGQKDRRHLGEAPRPDVQQKGQNRNDHSKPHSEGRRHESQERGSTFGGRGRGRGRDIVSQKDPKGAEVFSNPAHRPALHPSWEASKKRKEQQGQIMAFQGKKIKFDDDD